MTGESAFLSCQCGCKWLVNTAVLSSAPVRSSVERQAAFVRVVFVIDREK
jgi:hypothetical protein